MLVGLTKSIKNINCSTPTYPTPPPHGIKFQNFPTCLEQDHFLQLLLNSYMKSHSPCWSSYLVQYMQIFFLRNFEL